jgi:hypothetical protein
MNGAAPSIAMSIQKHPVFSFIEIATGNDFARHGRTVVNPCDAWRFAINGRVGDLQCPQASVALECAERELYLKHPHLVETKIEAAVMAGDFAGAMALAERRGFHQGRTTERTYLLTVIEATKNYGEQIGYRPPAPWDLAT